MHRQKCQGISQLGRNLLHQLHEVLNTAVQLSTKIWLSLVKIHKRQDQYRPDDHGAWVDGSRV